jgi:hypothetical protein
MTGIGTVCGGRDAAASACTPGTVTVPPASGGNDSCGYASSGFNESTVLCGITASGGGNAPAVIDVFYSDEHALTLGCATSSYPVSPQLSSPSAVYYPQTGDPVCTDTYGRPMRPVLFVTDITADPSCTSGDQQHRGTAYYPVAVFGSWKSATENATLGTPVSGDPSSNGWNLGAGADAVPSSVMTTCGGGGVYGAEIRFEAGLLPHHSYRLQVMLHDGDQNKGGDSGEGCAIYCATAGKACVPTCGVWMLQRRGLLLGDMPHHGRRADGFVRALCPTLRRRGGGRRSGCLRAFGASMHSQLGLLQRPPVRRRPLFGFVTVVTRATQ